MTASHIRAMDTKTSPEKSRADIEAALRRYGATGFTVSQDYANRTAVVAFTMPRNIDSGLAGGAVEVRLPVSFKHVRKRLQGIGRFNYKPDAQQIAQAERVAWRQLLLLVEAALASASIGLQTLEESFYAHTMLTLGDGVPTRAIDLVQTVQKRLGPGS